MLAAIGALLAFVGANVVIGWYAAHTHAFASHAAPAAAAPGSADHG